MCDYSAHTLSCDRLPPVTWLSLCAHEAPATHAAQEWGTQHQSNSPATILSCKITIHLSLACSKDAPSLGSLLHARASCRRLCSDSVLQFLLGRQGTHPDCSARINGGPALQHSQRLRAETHLKPCCKAGRRVLSHGCCSVLKQLVSCFPALRGQEGCHCCVDHSAMHAQLSHFPAPLLSLRDMHRMCIHQASRQLMSADVKADNGRAWQRRTDLRKEVC